MCLCVVRGGFAHTESVYVQAYVWERQSDGGERRERRLNTYLICTESFLSQKHSILTEDGTTGSQCAPVPMTN